MFIPKRGQAHKLSGHETNKQTLKPLEKKELRNIFIVFAGGCCHAALQPGSTMLDITYMSKMLPFRLMTVY